MGYKCGMNINKINKEILGRESLIRLERIWDLERRNLGNGILIKMVVKM